MGRYCLAASAALALLLQLSGCEWFISPQERIVRAEQRIAAADDRGALIELQNAVRSQPENTRAHLIIADISLRLGDPKSADKERLQAMKYGAAPEAVADLSARISLALGEYQQLLAQIQSGESALVEPARSTYRGFALLGMRQAERAIAAFNEALSADPRWQRARVGLAESLVSLGKSDSALEILEIVLAADAKDATGWLLRGTILSMRGEFRSASAALILAREHAAGQLSVSQYAATLATLTEAQIGAGDLQEAVKTQADLAKRAPGAAVTGLLAARIAMAQQDYATAVAEAQKVATAAPQLLQAKLLLGAALLAQGSLNQAEIQLAEVVRQAPENVEARKLLARANLQLQRPDIAMQVLQPAQQADIADAQLDALLGWANLQRGDNAAAIALLERGVSLQPENVNLKLDLALAYVTGDLNDKAVELLQSLPSSHISTRRDSLLLTALAAAKGIDAASAEMGRIVAARPKDPDVLNMAGMFYARQREFDLARDALARAAELQPGNASALMNLARAAAAGGDQKAASDAVEKALNIDPSHASARLARAEITARNGDIAGATQQLEKLRADDTRAIEPRFLLARIYLQQRQAHKADQVIREILVSAKEQPAVINAVGRLYLDASRFDEALSQFRNAVAQDAANPLYSLNVARTQFALGNKAAGRETLQKLVAQHPELVAANADLIMLDFRDDRRDAALEQLAALKKAHPDDATVAMLEGDLAMAAQSYGSAAEAYARAYRLAPGATAAVRTYRARQAGKLPKTTELLQSWLLRQPQDVTVRMVLAEAYTVAGKRDLAIEQYEQSVRGDRPNAMALNNLAWLYHENGNARAEETAKSAYALAPGVAAIADTYGWILVKAGRVTDGLPILRQAVSDSKSQPDIRYHYAAALAQAGQREAARRELQELTVGAAFASATDAQELLDALDN